MAYDTPQELWQQMQAGSLTLLDVRTPQAYTNGHVPGALSAPFSRMGWGRAVAAFMQARATAIALFADSDLLADAALAALRQAGVQVEAVHRTGPAGWQAAGLPLVAVQPLTVDQLRKELDAWTVIDVREPYEWRSGLVPGALRIPMGALPDKLQELDTSRRYAVICASGNRSQQAAAFLADNGLQAANVIGGMSHWLGAGHPVERP